MEIYTHACHLPCQIIYQWICKRKYLNLSSPILFRNRTFVLLTKTLFMHFMMKTKVFCIEIEFFLFLGFQITFLPNTPYPFSKLRFMSTGIICFVFHWFNVLEPRNFESTTLKAQLIYFLNYDTCPSCI